MRVHVAGVAIVFFLFAGSTTVRAGDAPGGTRTTVAGVTAAPVIDVWYGNDQRFGTVGTPQRRANILGTATHATGISSLSYRLNGGSSRTLNFTPRRRIASLGDFNIDLKFDELNPGANTVLIKAKANNGDSSETAVIVRDQTGSQVWPLPYTCAWTQFVDSVQILDGQWSLMGGGARIIQPGYDRLIAIGDTTWTDYEVTVKVTVHGLNDTQTAWDAENGGPGIGVLMRWKGHTNTPVFSPPITQPLSGYTPIGAIGWFHWRYGLTGAPKDQWEIGAPSGNDLAWYAGPQSPSIVIGTQYYFKMQVKSSGSGPLYKFKVWQVGAAEPGTWLMTRQEPTTALARGSLVLLAHHVSATFGEVKITPTPDSIPPVISNIVATTAATTATITWGTDEPATSSVAYGLTGSYGNVASDLANLVTSHSIQLQNLTPSTTYHYQVTSADWGGASSSSGDSTFQTTALTPPATLSPAIGAVGLPTTVRLSWLPVAGATSYRVQVGLDSTFASAITLDDSTIVDTTTTLGSLHAGELYHWRVRASVNGLNGPWSTTQYFKTALGVPALGTPANGADVNSLTSTVSWNSVPWAQAYRLQVSTDSTFSGVKIVDEWNNGETQRVLPQLAEATNYYWRVSARTLQVTGSFSSPWRFRTIQLLVAPVTLQPVNGATGLSTSEVFRWMKVAGAITYRLQVASDSTFAGGLIKNDSTITDTVGTVLGLAQGIRYYWRVQAKLPGGYTPYSAIWSFLTAYQLPAQAVLVSPAEAAHVTTDSVRFVWNKVQPGVTRYWLEAGMDPGFSLSLRDSTVADTTRKIYIAVRNRSYWWRVRGWNVGGWGPFSSVQSFVADEIQAVRREDEIPKSLSLDQNFPNPFNPTTTIRYALPHRSDVTLTVYSTLGQLVATLVNGDIDAGYHSVQFDASNLASGVYFYRLTAGSFVDTKRLLLIH